MRMIPLLFAVVFLIPGCKTDPVDGLGEITRRGELRWGGDEEGGGPYIFRAENGSNRLTGFEIDLFDHIGKSLNVTSTFKQAQWTSLLSELRTGNVDCVCNGLELTTERLFEAIATIPYFVYELHCFAGIDNNAITDWTQFHQPKPGGGRWIVGVLDGTAADTVMSKKFADHVRVKQYTGTVEAFRDVENKLIDATVTDTPAATFYGNKFKVKQVGMPFERGYYVVYLRPGDTKFRDKLNLILRMAIADGTMQTIYKRYGLWNEAQDTLLDPNTQSLPDSMKLVAPTGSNWSVVGNYWQLLLRAAGVTVLLSVLSMPIAIALGLFIAIVRLYAPRWLSWPFTIYVELIRGTPLLLQLLFIYFGLLPALGVASIEILRENAALIASVIGLAMNYAAYEAEIYRAGLLAIPAGQMEAALALGMTRNQAIRHIIVPQAVRLVVPPVTNDFINLFKDTAVCSVITVVDLSKMYNIAVNNAPRAFAELALVTALLYLAMSYPLSLLSRRLERPLQRTDH